VVGIAGRARKQVKRIQWHRYKTLGCWRLAATAVVVFLKQFGRRSDLAEQIRRLPHLWFSHKQETINV